MPVAKHNIAPEPDIRSINRGNSKLNDPLVVDQNPYLPNRSLSIIRNQEQFAKIKSEWNALHASNQSHQLSFQSYAWLTTWLEANNDQMAQSGQSLAIVTLRINSRLRVICPLVVQYCHGLVHLMWMGAPASQYGDVVTDGTTTSHQLVIEALNFAIKEIKPDIVHLRKVRGNAAANSWLEAVGAVKTGTDQAPFLDLRKAESFDQYCSRYSSKSRKNRRRLRRRLAERGCITTQILSAGPRASEAIEIGLEFKRQWLIDRGQVSSALHDKNVPTLLRSYAAQPDNLCRPFVSVMRCAGTPVSVQFGLLAKQRLALHLIAYNPTVEKSGVGVLHVEDTLRYCIHNGAIELDFLAPNATYKQSWADASVNVSDFVLACSIKGQLYARAYLCGTRNLLKTRVENLPLTMRRNIARHIGKSAQS